MYSQPLPPQTHFYQVYNYINNPTTCMYSYIVIEIQQNIESQILIAIIFT